MAQWIARWTSNPEVVGASPTWGAFFQDFVSARGFEVEDGKSCRADRTFVQEKCIIAPLLYYVRSIEFFVSSLG